LLLGGLRERPNLYDLAASEALMLLASIVCRPSRLPYSCARADEMEATRAHMLLGGAAVAWPSGPLYPIQPSRRGLEPRWPSVGLAGFPFTLR
jgi:hypothetical protein